jgi:hypothetical protein
MISKSLPKAVAAAVVVAMVVEEEEHPRKGTLIVMTHQEISPCNFLMRRAIETSKFALVQNDYDHERRVYCTISTTRYSINRRKI